MMAVVIARAFTVKQLATLSCSLYLYHSVAHSSFSPSALSVHAFSFYSMSVVKFCIMPPAPIHAAFYHTNINWMANIIWFELHDYVRMQQKRRLYDFNASVRCTTQQTHYHSLCQREIKCIHALTFRCSLSMCFHFSFLHPFSCSIHNFFAASFIFFSLHFHRCLLTFKHTANDTMKRDKIKLYHSCIFETISR